ncbi:putative AMD2-amidase [Tilletiaria anomala UBC 951]|uniref:amidase n=1 Tax=Tilletiaria anomala (strain ATCC 24038 / CBS 436.72 / UBC 951) TaxID=1037660 RepID=A0A066WL67_TILAU|nr:putative AMD2-amidase [Tilletiaria anomala UBC 951]KDN53323.1 putative AMD2-amidase [Tilletiaria anomala UBC 951]
MTTSDAAPPFQPVAQQKQRDRDAKIPAEWRLPPSLLDSLHIPPSAKIGTASPLPCPVDVRKVNVRDVPRTCGILTEKEVDIVGLNPVQLVHRLHVARDLSAFEVAQAFCKSAAVAHQLTNCLTEILFDEALARAQQVDDYLVQHGKPIGSLAGVPISIKDNFRIKGHDATLGFACWANEPDTYDSTLITILRDAGAILYCKTNVPTAMMIAETLNNLWGRTLNPYNLATSCGGSSGGEGALIALRGSPLGVGTDIGGSIRIPAALCGLYSLKPSFGRFPTHNARSGMAGQEAVNSINGPMTTSLDAIELFASAVVGSQPWLVDPKCVPIPWKPVGDIERKLPQKGLVFGLLRHNGVVRPTPPVARALEMTAKALEQAGHEVVVWHVESNEFADAARILEAFFAAEGRHGIRNLLLQGGEGDHWVKGLNPVVKPLTLKEIWDLQAERSTWSASILAHWSRIKGSSGRLMDALISPATPYAGVPHDTFTHVAYTGAWNLTDQPGVTIPITVADAYVDDGQNEAFLSEVDQKAWSSYDAKLVDGSPVAIQLIGRRLQEETLLALAKVVDAAACLRSI